MARRKLSFSKTDVRAMWALHESMGNEPVYVRYCADGSFCIVCRKNLKSDGSNSPVFNEWDEVSAMVRFKKPYKGVKSYWRRGKIYSYHRSTKIRLPGQPGSEEFFVALRKAESEVQETPLIGADRVKPGSFDALIPEYYLSSGFTSLAPSTQSTYRNQLEEFREQHGDKSVSGLRAKHIDAILGALARRSTAQAHKLRKRLLKLMSLAVTWGYRSDNPMQLAQRIVHKERGYRPWTEDDIELYRAHWAVGTPQRIALEVLLHTGLRRSDAVRLGRQHRRGKDHVIAVRKSGETIDAVVPVHPTLEKHLEHVPKGCLTYIVTERGIGRSEKAFTNWIIEAARAAGLPPRSSPHGLRKATCRRLAEAGCPATQIMAITGQSLSVVERYIRDFNRLNAATSAMAAIHDPMNENESQTKLSNGPTRLVK